MSIEDKRMYRLLEHEIYRNQNLDLSDMRVSVNHGIGFIGGVLRPATGLYYLNIRDEIRILTECCRRVPGLKDVVVDARLESSPKR